MTGGVSSPSKSRRASEDLPGSMPMYDPESRVPMPDTVPPAMRARTTQKRVSSTTRSSAALERSALTRTPVRSSPSEMLFTTPISTSLYFTRVLPASMPSAVLNRIVTVGPCDITARTASQPPITAAMSGSSHTHWNPQRRFGAASASGISGNSGRSAMTFLPVSRIPDQPRIEAHRSEYRQHDDSAERERAGCGSNLSKHAQLDERDEYREYVDVQHRPAPDKLEKSIQTRQIVTML